MHWLSACKQWCEFVLALLRTLSLKRLVQFDSENAEHHDLVLSGDEVSSSSAVSADSDFDFAGPCSGQLSCLVRLP